MKRYIVKRTNGKPDWARIPEEPITVWGPERNEDVSAKAQAAWDTDGLYVRLQVAEPEIRSEVTDPWDEPCKDSCLEFFFSPEPPDLRYLNFECNPNGVLYLGYGSGLPTLVRVFPDTPFPEPLIKRTGDGWEVSFFIPAEYVRRFFPDFTLSSGKKLRANFYKCGDLTVRPHYLMWNEVNGEPFTFHAPEQFGELLLE